jgi:hypothetical protein
MRTKLENALDASNINHHPAFGIFGGVAAVAWNDERVWIAGMDEEGNISEVEHDAEQLDKVKGGTREKALALDEWMRGE